MPEPVVPPATELSAGRYRCSLYQEVVGAWSSDDEFTLAAPWISVGVRLPSNLRRCLSVDELLADLTPHLLGFPLVELLPRAELSGPADWPAVDWSDPQDDICFASLAQTSIGQAGTDVAGRLGICSVEQLSLIVHQSAVRDDAVDATSAFSLLRRYVFLALARQADRNRIIALDREKILLCLQQSFYLTSKSVDALSAGLNGNGNDRFKAALASYVEEERGHHELILSSLKALGARPDDRLVSPYTVHAVDMLRWCSTYSPFALANCLSFFEMGGYLDEDPLVASLERIGEPEAAKPIRTHFLINKRYDHASIGLHLSNTLGEIPPSELRVAVAALETTSFSMLSAIPL